MLSQNEGKKRIYGMNLFFRFLSIIESLIIIVNMDKRIYIRYSCVDYPIFPFSLYNIHYGFFNYWILLKLELSDIFKINIGEYCHWIKTIFLIYLKTYEFFIDRFLFFHFDKSFFLCQKNEPAQAYQSVFALIELQKHKDRKNLSNFFLINYWVTLRFIKLENSKNFYSKSIFVIITFSFSF